ncbi:Ada metal-binding domain-containing protein [Streptomyces sp. NPDC014724]|uniref:Ada metal-binding domain-containing protein n=1 Tax=unclassified Streptomyces TaxID=2593676 RepID=UPI0036F60E9D
MNDRTDTRRRDDRRVHTLLGPDGEPYRSVAPGTFGGHRRSRLYGRLDCPCALRALARGQYVSQRVFFADESTAVRAGYRPCAVCLPKAYARWKASGRRDRNNDPEDTS